MSNHSSKIDAGSDNFSSWLQESNDHLVVVAFVAKWVGMAEVLIGYVDAIKEEELDFATHYVDADVDVQLTVNMGVNQLPSTILLRNQEIVDHIDGLIPKRRLAERIKRFV